jgi:hypothetical protein
MKRKIELIEYYDHYWVKLDVEADWEEEIKNRVTITTIGAVVFEDDVQVSLLVDFGTANKHVEGHVQIHNVVKSCIIRRINLGTKEVGI